MVSLALDVTLAPPKLAPPELADPEYERSSSVPTKTRQLSYSVGVMAYNEEANIRRALNAILEQEREKTCLSEIIVVASGCTDRTVPIVREYMREEPCIRLIVQKEREGKASAINLFLQHATSPLLVLVGADTLPEKDTLERLCTQFEDETIGMVGARPVPLNDQNTFIGHAVHLLWRLHDSIARRVPRRSEVVAFRNIVKAIPTDTAVDEISIQASIAQQGLRMVYVPEAFVYNKGPLTIRDFLAQRRRIYCGYLQARAEGHYIGSRVKAITFLRVLFENAPYAMNSPRQICWTAGAMVLEGLARLRGAHDLRHHPARQMVLPTRPIRRSEEKDRRRRRIYNSQSVIVFQVSRMGKERDCFFTRNEERYTLRMARSLLPVVRKNIRKGDLLSLHGSNTLVLLINADPCMVHSIALRLKYLMESQRVQLCKDMVDLPRVRYHAVTFTQELPE